MTNNTQIGSQAASLTGALAGTAILPGAGTALGGGAGALMASLFSSIFGGDDAEKAAALYQKAFEQYNQMGMPPDQRDRLILKEFQSAGLYTPQVEELIQQGPSLVNQIQEDPALKAAQMQALTGLAGRAQGGLMPEDIAAFNKMRNQVAADQQARQGAILEAAQRRGQGAEGNALLAQLTGSQASANRAAEAGDELGATASRNALQSLTQYGSLGGQIRGQEFSQAQAKAAAQDAINQFNAQAAIGTQSRNVGAKNVGQLTNLQNQQAIMDRNVQQANAESYAQQERARQYWQNQLTLAQSKANAMAGQASVTQNAADKKAATWMQLGTGAGQTGGTLAEILINKKKEKTETPGPVGSNVSDYTSLADKTAKVAPEEQASEDVPQYPNMAKLLKQQKQFTPQ